jgi:heme/copper-type cytochrome/quinol oxidase subunit 2
MFQTPGTAPLTQGKTSPSSSAFVYVQLLFGMLFCMAIISGTYLVLEKAFGNPMTTRIAHAVQPQQHVRLNLNIVINQPGMQKDWPAYSPTHLVVPANSLVTVTLRDYDLGDTALPKNSPFTTVQGTVDRLAYADGKAYSSLAPEKVAHTFTISQLNINVPLPGDAPKGATFDTITFTFHTSKAGTYTFQCFDPCGTGSSGWEGPMVTKGYMMGTLTVQ